MTKVIPAADLSQPFRVTRWRRFVFELRCDPMLKAKTILCAIDFSKSSLNALQWSLREGKLIHAHVTILFCYRLIPGQPGTLTDIKKKIEQEANLKFQKIETEVIKGDSPAYQFLTEVGFFSSRIASIVDNLPVCMVVMGSSIVKNFNDDHHPAFEEFLYKATVPVVVVPGGHEEVVRLESPVLIQQNL